MKSIPIKDDSTLIRHGVGLESYGRSAGRVPSGRPSSASCDGTGPAYRVVADSPAVRRTENIMSIIIYIYSC